MNASNLAAESKGPTTLSRLARWAYTPRRPLVFIVVESWVALLGEALILALDAGDYPAILVRIAFLATGALIANRLLRRSGEERVQEDLEQDLAILEQLRLTPSRTQREKARLFRVYLAAVEQLRDARAATAAERKSPAAGPEGARPAGRRVRGPRNETRGERYGSRQRAAA